MREGRDGCMDEWLWIRIQNWGSNTASLLRNTGKIASLSDKRKDRYRRLHNTAFTFYQISLQWKRLGAFEEREPIWEKAVSGAVRVMNCPRWPRVRVAENRICAGKDDLPATSVTTWINSVAFYFSTQPYCHYINTIPLEFAFPSAGKKTFPVSIYVRVIGACELIDNTQINRRKVY